MKDYTDAADWAEHEMRLDVHSTTALRGDIAAASGADVLRRAGRPPLDRTVASGHRSPQRTLRLPPALDGQLAAVARAEGRTPSDIMRAALAEYLEHHTCA